MKDVLSNAIFGFVIYAILFGLWPVGCIMLSRACSQPTVLRVRESTVVQCIEREEALDLQLAAADVAHVEVIVEGGPPATPQGAHQVEDP